METQTQLGMRWMRESIFLFKARPALWLLSSFMYLIIFVLLPALFSILGIATVIFWPMSVTFIVMLFRQFDAVQKINITTVIATVKKHIVKLILLGLCCLLYGALIGVFLRADTSIIAEMRQSNTPMSPEQLSQFLSVLLSLTIKGLLLVFPLLIATWFAPMLIALNAYSVIKAIKSSIAGTMRYAVALGLTGLVIFGLMVGVTLLLGVILGVIGAILPKFIDLVVPYVLVLAVLATNALMFAFQYVSYRDAFNTAPQA